jgi:glycerol-3-phosphate acyltransferase PlsY
MEWQLIVIAILAYLIGSINLSIIIGKYMKKIDIRDYGSGNAGTTNTLRVLGKGPAILVLLFDVLKAVIAIYLAKLIMLGSETTNLYGLAICISGLAVILGHNFPIYYGFKGGKGIATSLGTLLTVEPKIGLICLIFALVIMVISRMVSLGSIAAAILYPVLVLVMGNAISNKLYYMIFALLLSALAIWRHRANIERIKNGTENKLWSKKEKTKLN